MKIKYIDAHGHLHFSDYDNDREEVYGRMQDNEVALITVGTNIDTSFRAVECAGKYKNVWATVGVHPNEISVGVFANKEFEKLLSSKKVVGIGECGLDYYRLKSENIDLAIARQKKAFEMQIEFALSHDLPLMLHCRPTRGSMDAYIDVYEILQSFARNNSNLRGNVHFFVGDVDVARKFLSINFTLSFTGVVTFARDYDEVVRYVPSNMILSETDSPYVAPLPHRGKRNEPAYVISVVEKLAWIRGSDKGQMREAILNNAKRAFAMADSV